MNAKTILIADDCSIVLKILEVALRSAGYNVVTAQDPSEAMEKVRREKPDVIIMDINFPPDVGFGGGGTWDGYRVLEWMKMNNTLGDAAQIIITSENIERHRDHVQEAGIAGLFQKPIDKKALLDRIRECLKENDPSTVPSP